MSYDEAAGADYEKVYDCIEKYGEAVEQSVEDSA